MIYSDLKADVAANLHRSDITATLYNNWAQRVQLYLRRRLRASANLTRTTLTATSGVIALPSDFAEMRAVINPHGTALRPAGPNDWNRYSERTGKSLVYLVDTAIRTAPLESGDFTVEYYAAPALLTADADQVDVGLEDLHLYGMLLEGCLWTQDPALAAEYRGLLVEAVRDLNTRHQREQQPVAYTDYDLTVPPRAL